VRLVFATLVACLVVAGCRSPEGPAAVGAVPKAPAEPWRLISYDPLAETPSWLSNGLVGVRIGRDGAGASGRFLLIDSYQRAGEEKIEAGENPLEASWTVAGVPLNPEVGEQYEQTLDMRTGVLSTRWRQRVGEARIRIQTETLVHPEKALLGRRWRLESDRPTTFSLQSSLPGERIPWPGARPPEGDRMDHVSRLASGHRLWWSGVADTPSSTSTRTDGATPWTRSGETAKSFHQGRAIEVEEVWRVDGRSSGPFRETTERLPTLDELIDQTRSLWAARWETDIVVDGPVEDQQAIRSFLFYLRSSVHPDGGMSVSPLALSGTTYFGHVFWDADLWVFPALAFIDPERAAAIADYRLQRLPQARRNFEDWLAEGRPVANRALGEHPPVEGAMFPWESSVTGRETVPGPSRYQHHITGTVAFALAKASALGLADEGEVRKALQGARGFYAARVEEGGDGLGELRATMSPDEHKTGDNDLYTNLLAQWVLNGGTWKRPAGVAEMRLPRDGQSFLTYDGDMMRSYKQAAAVLAIYPLQFPAAEAEADAMMRRFADKVTEHGPAMSDSVHALIWARIGEGDRGYELWRRSWEEFSKEPHLLFSEKRRKEVSYFTTGAGGCLQTVLFGFAGFRIDWKQDPAASWSHQLAGENWLTINPNLPSRWKSLRLENFHVRGRRFTLTATHDGTTVTQGG
jgi:trehalose/maltose hydrolase-like predicted phosphorylase